MRLLAIESSTTVSSVALADGERVLASMSGGHGRGHAEFLMPAIETCCARAGFSVRDVTAVAVGLGPGLFTGMRVGVVTAKTIAQTLGVPIVGVSSLDVVAAGVRHAADAIVACVDAKRDEVFAAFYRATSTGVSHESDYLSLSPTALAAEVVARAHPFLMVGSGALAYAEQFTNAGARVADADVSVPDATVLCELARPLIEEERFTPVGLVEPLYLRRSDAEINWERRGTGIQRPNRIKIPGRSA